MKSGSLLSVLLYGIEEKQTGHVDINGLSQGWEIGF
jgi:hypothetical protein